MALNRGPFLGAQPPLELLDAPRGQLLDVRTAAVHAAGHAPGAVNVPLDGSSVGTKAGFVLDHDELITIHASSAGRSAESARRLNAVGLLGIAGYVLELETPERLEPVGIEELEALLAQDAVEVLDVREKDERDEGYIPGSGTSPTGWCAPTATSSTTAGPWSRSAPAARAPAWPRACSPRRACGHDRY